MNRYPYHCDTCGNDGHRTGDCCYCGSSRHSPSRCNIKQKADLMTIGIPPEHLFDHVIEADSVGDAVEWVKEQSPDAN